jgi:hypothetical protein
MGFLDHTTNNVIIDAVLTERGRELLSKNDGSFVITSFSFGDDEVDYSNIVKYGLQMGKEKIEKNTPVFEAQTNENLALKYNNISLNNNTLRILFIPYLKKYGTLATTPIELNFSDSTKFYKEFQVLSTLSTSSGQNSIDSNLRDSQFEMKINNLILKRYNSGLEVSDYLDLDENNIATYRISATAANANTYEGFALDGRYLLTSQIGLSFTSPTIGLTTFERFGKVVNNSYVIDTQIELVGMSSGSRMIIPVKIIGPTV